MSNKENEILVPWSISKENDSWVVRDTNGSVIAQTNIECQATLISCAPQLCSWLLLLVNEKCGVCKKETDLQCCECYIHNTCKAILDRALCIPHVEVGQ